MVSGTWLQAILIPLLISHGDTSPTKYYHEMKEAVSLIKEKFIDLGLNEPEFGFFYSLKDCLFSPLTTFDEKHDQCQQDASKFKGIRHFDAELSRVIRNISEIVDQFNSEHFPYSSITGSLLVSRLYRIVFKETLESSSRQEHEISRLLEQFTPESRINNLYNQLIGISYHYRRLMETKTAEERRVWRAALLKGLNFDLTLDEREEEANELLEGQGKPNEVREELHRELATIEMEYHRLDQGFFFTRNPTESESLYNKLMRLVTSEEYQTVSRETHLLLLKDLCNEYFHLL